jgi:hypothetical protein
MMAVDAKLKMNVEGFKSSRAFLKDMGSDWKLDMPYISQRSNQIYGVVDKT